MEIGIQRTFYAKDKRDRQFQQKPSDALQEIPGLDSVSAATATPFQDGLPLLAFTLRDYVLPKGSPQPAAYMVGVSQSYLKTMQIPLIEGRWFTDADTEKSRPVFVANRDFARHYFGDRSAVGQRFAFGSPQRPEDWMEIISVVGDVRHLGAEQSSGAVQICSRDRPDCTLAGPSGGCGALCEESL